MAEPTWYKVLNVNSGEPLCRCQTCGALVGHDDWPLHDQWHQHRPAEHAEHCCLSGHPNSPRHRLVEPCTTRCTCGKGDRG